MMKDNEDIRRYSAEELKQVRDRGETESRAAAPVYAVDEAFWTSARVIMPPSKASVHLRMDSDVLDWFRGQGKGHLTRMNAVLRSFMDAHKQP